MPYQKDTSALFKKKYGITISSARNRLMRSLIFALLKENGHHFCYRCGKEMDDKNYTIEHIEPWAHKDDSWELYFDLSNIAFSHDKCNYSNTRKNTDGNKKYHLSQKGKRTKTDLEGKSRKCSSCGKWLCLIVDFRKSNSNKRNLGRSYDCNECHRRQERERKQKKKSTT